MSTRGAKQHVWLALAVAFATVFSSCGPSQPELQRLFTVQDFRLVQSNGRSFSPRDLRGKVWVASFLFTHCTQICPTLAAQLRNLETRLASVDNVRIVSITVDPETDTPAVLENYRKQFAQTSKWIFLTGAPSEVHNVITERFLQPFPERRALGQGYDLLHRGSVLLFDQEGVCRGTFPLLAAAHASAQQGQTDLLHAIAALSQR